MKANTVNQKLGQLYQSRWADLIKALQDIDEKGLCDEYTSPLLLQFSTDYFRPNHKRIMVFGQETRGWTNKVNTQLVAMETILNTYERYFITNKMKYTNKETGKLVAHSSFRRGIQNLKKQLHNKSIEFDLIWNNINKIGRDIEQTGVNKDVHNIEMAQFNVLTEELNIIQPDVLLFFTGPNNDNKILTKLPHLELTCYKDAKPRQFKCIVNKNTQKVIGFRTYHPNYYRGFYPTMKTYGNELLIDLLQADS